MKAKAAYVHDMFSSLTGSYDLLNTIFSFKQDKRWRRFASSKSGLKRGDAVLDVATGTGKLAFELARVVGRDGLVVGVDFCEDMLSKGRNTTMEPVLADAESLPFPDNSFDCAAIGFGLRNVTSIEKSLREMTRVIKKGGVVICLEFTMPRNRVLRRIYYFYLYRILRPIAGIISGRRDAYEYLPRSISAFLKPDELKALMEKVGLNDIQIYSLTWGVTTLHIGTKSE
jgi:demethylmenaquinone methyltransferase/2-methoxy-6-polyprenyl-1,4-benzoquinol methylase